MPAPVVRQFEKLRNPPVIEGIVDFRVESNGTESGSLTPAGLSDSEMRQFADSIQDRFPVREERIAIEGSMTIGPGGTSNTVSQKLGALVARTAKGDRAVQCHRNGLTCSVMSPYGEWEELLGLMEWAWPRYRTLQAAARITRIGVRFINRVPLLTPGQLEDTFTVFARPPLDGFGAPSEYLMRMVGHHLNPDCVVILTQVLDGPTNTHCFLDIDIAHQPENGIADAAAWQRLQELRGVKNAVFFSTISAPAKEMMR